MTLSDSLTTVLPATIALLVAFGKALKTLYEFHDEYLLKRRFKRLTFLKEEASGDERLSRFIDATKKELVFASAFGRSASPRLAAAIAEVHETRLFSVWELRLCRYYMRLNDEGRVKIEIGKFGFTLATVICLFVIGFAGYVAYVVLLLLATKQLAAIATAVVILIGFFLLGAFLMKDALEVFVALRVGRQLERHRAEVKAIALVSDLPDAELAEHLVMTPEPLPLQDPGTSAAR